MVGQWHPHSQDQDGAIQVLKPVLIKDEGPNRIAWSCHCMRVSPLGAWSDYSRLLREALRLSQDSGTLRGSQCVSGNHWATRRPGLA